MIQNASFLLLFLGIIVSSTGYSMDGEKKRSYLDMIHRLGSLPRKIKELAAANKDHTSDNASPRAPKTPDSSTSSATASPRTPHGSQTLESDSLQTQKQAIIQLQKEEHQKKAYLKKMQKYIKAGQVEKFKELLQKYPKNITPRLIQWITLAKDIPVKDFLQALATTNETSFQEVFQRFNEQYGKSPLHEAASLNNHDALLFFADKLHITNSQSPYFTIDIVTDDQNRTPLFDAKSVATVKQLLRVGAKVNACDNRGNTFLHYCCADGNADIIATLLEHGADINQRNAESQTPLLYRIPPNSESFTKMLGAPRTQLSLCDARGHNMLHRLILSKASPEHKVEFARILKNLGISMTQQDIADANLPHHCWAAYGNLPGAKELMQFALEECGINVFERNKKLKTALDFLTDLKSSYLNSPTHTLQIGPFNEDIKRASIIEKERFDDESGQVDSLENYLKQMITLEWAKQQMLETAQESEHADNVKDNP